VCCCMLPVICTSLMHCSPVYFVVLGMTKVKVTKEESGSLDFVEKRRAALER